MNRFALEDCKGVIPAMLTFFDEQERVDDRRTREMTEYMVQAGVGGLYLTGSTGECFMMTAAERNHVVELVMDQVQGRCPVIVHVGDIGTQSSIDLARFAQEAGATAISSVPPFYWRFSEDAICRYYEDVSNAVDIPMVVYNIELAGIMRKETILRIAENKNVKGLKYTARTHDVLGELKDKLGAHFMIYSGCDEMAFSGLSFGADGIIGSFYNVFPELFIKLNKAVQQQQLQEAVRLQKIANAIIVEALKYDFPSVMHTMMRWRGLDSGYSRKPFRTYTDSELQPLKQVMQSVWQQSGEETLQYFFAG
jgi:N-acetylneuraminate lyase